MALLATFFAKFARTALLPLAWCYDAVTRLRNWAFDRGYLPTRRFNIPIIGVGNLAVGGTGKTPHTQWIVEELLQMGKRVAVLSRGYGRKTKGFRRIKDHCTANEVGDEPLQLFRHFMGRNFIGAVCEKRVVGIELLLQLPEPPEVIVLDDAFQHRYVSPGLNVLLTDFSLTYDRDTLLPAGRLRENAQGAARADIIIVTKCPVSLAETTRHSKALDLRMAHPLRPSASELPIFFTSVAYPPLPQVEKCLLITGIAKPEPLVSHLSQQGIAVEHLNFPDHHHFSASDRQRIIDCAAHHSHIFTTDKDLVRLEQLDLPTTVRDKIQPISITVQILFDQSEELRQILTHYVSSDSRNSSVDSSPN